MDFLPRTGSLRGLLTSGTPSPWPSWWWCSGWWWRSILSDHWARGGASRRPGNPTPGQTQCWRTLSESLTHLSRAQWLLCRKKQICQRSRCIRVEKHFEIECLQSWVTDPAMVQAKKTGRDALDDAKVLWDWMENGLLHRDLRLWPGHPLVKTLVLGHQWVLGRLSQA